MFETDETLIRRILQGKDREAGELLVERHYKRIYKEIYLKTSDEELAKDLTQEASGWSAARWRALSSAGAACRAVWKGSANG